MGDYGRDEIVRGSDIIYSIIPVKASDIELVNGNHPDPLHHNFAGYIVNDISDNTYKFYSVEDNYKNAIENHWTTRIVRRCHRDTHWFLVKEHPCKLYGMLTQIYGGNYVSHVNNFDIWKSDEKSCLVAVVTDIELD